MRKPLSGLLHYLAAIYLGGVVGVALTLGIGRLANARDIGTRAALLALLMHSAVLVALLPLRGVMASDHLLGSSTGADWLLFNRYLTHLAFGAFDGHLSA